MLLREYFNILLDMWGKRHSEEEETKLVTEIDKLAGTSGILDGEKRWELLAVWLEEQAIKQNLTADDLIAQALSWDTVDEVVKALQGDLKT